MAIATFPKQITQTDNAFGNALRARRLLGDGERSHKVDWCCAVTGYSRKQWYNWESGAQKPGYNAIRALRRLYPDLDV